MVKYVGEILHGNSKWLLRKLKRRSSVCAFFGCTLYIVCPFCCRTAAGLGMSSRVECKLQAATPAEKHDWLLELQNVRLALG